MKKEVLVIIDGNSFIHRAYNALPPLTNKEGFPTSAITGTTNMIQSILKNIKPDKIVIAFDAKGKNFRHEMYADYKANRSPMDNDLRVQIEPIKEIIKAWGLTVMCIPGVEADDSMSSLGVEAVKLGYKVILATSDKDMRQMVSDDISILDTKDIEKSTTLMGPKEVFEKNGVYPDQIIDLLALMGDTADNIPGVNGCGEKTAVKWINEYGNVKGVIENADNIAGKIGEKLRASIDDLKMSYELVVIDQNVECNIDFENLEIKTNNDEMYKLTTKYQLNRLRDELKLINSNAKSIEVEIISDTVAVASFIETMIAQKENLYIDNIPLDIDHVIAMNKKESKSYILNIRDNEENFIKIIKENIKIISTDGKELIKALYKILQKNIIFNLNIIDVRIINYIINGGQSKIVSIEKLNEFYAQLDLSASRKKYKLDDKAPKWEKMEESEIKLMKAEELMVATNVSLDIDENLRVEFKLLNILAYMELTGTLLDVNKLNNQGNDLINQINKVEKEIYTMSDCSFNINSPKQVSEVLFNKLAIPSKKKSTAEDVLIKLSSDYPIVTLILKYRSLTKLKSTYIDGLIERADNDNRVHTTYNQTITTTGRLSSSNPNLQNIPIKTEEGKEIRTAFVAKAGYKILALDYSQIELRILAHLSKEQKMINAFLNNKDIHKSTASELFGVAENEITADQRRNAKSINFGLIYGMSARRLAEELGIKKSVALKYQEDYFNKYENIKPYFEKELLKAKEQLYIKTLNGRSIPTKDVNSNNSFIKNHAELSAKNAGIQGTAADIMKMAMVNVFEYMKKENSFEYANLLMQVHDELVFEVTENEIENFALKIKDIMESSVSLVVPLLVDFNIGDDWLSAH